MVSAAKGSKMEIAVYMFEIITGSTNLSQPKWEMGTAVNVLAVHGASGSRSRLNAGYQQWTTGHALLLPWRSKRLMLRASTTMNWLSKNLKGALLKLCAIQKKYCLSVKVSPKDIWNQQKSTIEQKKSVLILILKWISRWGIFRTATTGLIMALDYTEIFN
jgi:hypothetical protein